MVVQKRKIWWAISLFLVMLYFSGLPTQAQYGGGNGTTASAETKTYVFLPGQSTVVQTGGFAGVHWTYSVEGQFQLTVDPDAGTASFAHVDANATDDSPLQRSLDLNEVFNMTSLLGTVLNDTTISFTGKAADGSDVLITVTIEDDLAYLLGQTTPPPNTADFFLFSLDAAAQRKYGKTSTHVFLSDESTVVKTGGFAGVHETYPIEGQFQLTVDANAGVASFDYVDAFLLSPISSSGPQSLGELFNMTELVGTVVNDALIEFRGKTADNTNTDITLTLTFTDAAVQLTGQTIPPPNSADFFIYELDAVAQRKYGGGTGEPNDPYLIYTAKQMNVIGLHEEDWDKHFKLMADIDLSAYTGTSFNIIVSLYDSFRGVFDGNGKTISNFTYISTDANWVALFGYVRGENALIKDLGLIDPNVDAGTSGMVYGGQYFGSLVGRLSEGTITGCYVEGGSVSGIGNVGALVGLNWGGTITNCYATGSVTGTGWRVGGLVGTLSNEGTITNCYATGRVLGVGNVGGLVGVNSGTISNCYSSGDVSGNEDVGGLVGEILDGTIANCYSSGDVSGDGTVGGLVGSHDPWGLGWGEITFSFWDTQTSGQATSDGGTGKTTAEMQTESTFTDAGWDFMGESVNGTEDVWSICEGTNYPRFVWQIPAGDFVCPDGITIDDFAFFTDHWRDDNCDISNDYCQGTDLDFSGTVDEADLEIFFENWLEGGN